MITSPETYVLNILVREILRETSNYWERIALFDLTHMMSMADLVETIRINSGSSLDKEFSKLICMNS